MSKNIRGLNSHGFARVRNGRRSSIFLGILPFLTLGLFTRRSEKTANKTKDNIQEPARISLSFQFERVAQVVEDAISHSESIQALHRETSQQLDATEYALHRLFDEIHNVIPGIEKPVYGNAVAHTGEAETYRPDALAA